MDRNTISRRDFDFERRYGFLTNLDYKAELDKYNRLVLDQDKEGLQDFAKRHGGRIAFFAKVFYYKELNEAGLLP